MISAILEAAFHLDHWLAAHVGRPYRVLLGIGLVVEIVQRLGELGERSRWEDARSGFAIALFIGLLIHQLSELHRHHAGRPKDRGGRHGRR